MNQSEYERLAAELDEILEKADKEIEKEAYERGFTDGFELAIKQVKATIPKHKGELVKEAAKGEEAEKAVQEMVHDPRLFLPPSMYRDYMIEKANEFSCNPTYPGEVDNVFYQLDADNIVRCVLSSSRSYQEEDWIASATAICAEGDTYNLDLGQAVAKAKACRQIAKNEKEVEYYDTLIKGFSEVPARARMDVQIGDIVEHYHGYPEKKVTGEVVGDTLEGNLEIEVDDGGVVLRSLEDIIRVVDDTFRKG
jgi:hypothetical protein